MASDYGQKVKSNQGFDADMYLPGSPDARMSSRGDMYDQMGPTSGYGKKVDTKKNKTGTGAPNTGIQGSQEKGNKNQTQDKSERVRMGSKSYQKHYANQAASTSKGNPGSGDGKDYGKGR